MGRPIKKPLIQLVFIHVYGDGTRRLITKQKGSRRYEAETHGDNVFTLVGTNSLIAGQAYIKATDDNGNTYFVTKLTRHKATLVRWEQNGSEDWLFANSEAGAWTFGNAQAGEFKSVQIENDD